MQRTIRSRTLWLGLFVALAAWGFLKVADEFAGTEVAEFDSEILLSLRVPGDVDNPIGPIWVEELARDITALGSTVVLGLITFGIVVYFWLQKRGAVSAFILASSVLGVSLSLLLKDFYDRPRPTVVPHEMHALTKSFPSGHAMMSAIVFLGLGAVLCHSHRRRRLQLYFASVAVSLTVLIGLSRLYLGVHWPTDVIAGWLAGSSWALLSWLLARKLLVSSVTGEAQTNPNPEKL